MSVGRQLRVKSFLALFLFLSVHGPGAKPSYKTKKNCPWTWSMTGGPWTRSMKVVHGPCPKRGSMDPWSMFCPHPFDVAQTWCGTPCYLSPELCQNVPYSSKADVWVKSLCLSAETTPCYSKKKILLL